MDVTLLPGDMAPRSASTTTANGTSSSSPSSATFFAAATCCCCRSRIEPAEQIRLVESWGSRPTSGVTAASLGFLSNSLKSAAERRPAQRLPLSLGPDVKDEPIAPISLYAMVIPDEPRRRCFASGVRAAARLPEDVRAEFARKRRCS